jgi:hypothetical protein
MEEDEYNTISHQGCFSIEGQFNSNFSIKTSNSTEFLFSIILESRSGTGENARNPDYLHNLEVILGRLRDNFFDLTSIQNASSSQNIASRDISENTLYFENITYPINLSNLNINQFTSQITTALRQNGNTQTAGTTQGRILLKVNRSNTIELNDFNELIIYENLSLIRPLIDQIKENTINIDAIKRKPLLKENLKREIAQNWPHDANICDGYIAFETQTGLIERTTDADLINYANCVLLYDELFKYSAFAKKVFSEIDLENETCERFGEKTFIVSDDIKNQVNDCVQNLTFLNDASKSLLTRFIVDDYDSRKNDLGPYKGITRDDSFSPVAAEATIARKDNSIRNDIIKLYIKNRELALKLSKEINNLRVITSCDVKNIASDFTGICLSSNLTFEKGLINRFTSSLLTKPFLILSGLSGSGKTKLAQAFANWICESKKQFELVPVGADWTNKEHLLGYYDSINDKYESQPALNLILEAGKEENKDKPYFLILDEMNLSHVERYFSDFLSVIESGGNIFLHDAKLVMENKNIPQNIDKLPENLFVIGTVNMDETTYVFSPKVLDRANVIEFRVQQEEFDSFIESPQKVDLAELEKEGAAFARDFVISSRQKEFEEIKEIKKLKSELKVLFKNFQNNGWDFGYRVGYEITRYINFHMLISEDQSWEAALDAQIVQKLMPKLNGSANRLKGILKSLACYSVNFDNSKNEADKSKEKVKSGTFDDPEKLYIEKKNDVVLKLTFEKTYRMWMAAKANGFTSFAEN